MDSHLDYLLIAYKHAQKFSTDPSSQNAALLVDPNGTIFVQAANYFPSGVEETPERWERPLKYSFVEHAERNAIYAAAADGFSTRGCTMYVPWFACADCARAIIQCGIVEVIGHDAPIHKSRQDWHKSVEVAEIMFKEAGVKFSRIPGEMKGIKIRFNGELLEP